MVSAAIEGERGHIHFFAVMLDYPLNASVVRQDQVRQLAQLISSDDPPSPPDRGLRRLQCRTRL